MNGLAVPDAGGALPIIPGLAISSIDLTPPLPAANDGTINPLQAVTIEFDVTINGGTANGTVIQNQAW